MDLDLSISERDRNNIYNKKHDVIAVKRKMIHTLVRQKLVPTYRLDINKFPIICLRKYFRFIGEMYS